jgi:4-amino-4-deoxy-L-arabinose transferase-like glycosyltransferase
VDTKPLKAVITNHYPLLIVLIASWLLSASMGTYTNWDAEKEYEAAASILTRGFPYVSSGLMINQAPLCFYTTAAAMQFTGEGYINGVAVVDVFGLGCVAAIYALGAVLYGRKTGLVAAALFGFVPWHVFLSRIYLIDNEYLFFSLVFLAVGALAVRYKSEKLVLAAGIIFGLSLMTKLFAAFALVPMALIIYVNQREGGVFRLTRRNLAIFVTPTLVLHAVWYGLFANQQFFGVYFNSDFTHPNRVANPILAFVPITMVDSAGVFLFAAAGLAVAFGLIYRRKLARFLRLDAVLLLSIAFVVAVNMFMAVVLHSNPAYISAVKYSYLALPFFCVLAASVIDKGRVLWQETGKTGRWIVALLVGVGAALVLASLIESTLFLNEWYPFAAFGVDTVSYFPFFLNTPAPPLDTMVPMQYGALALAVLAMFLQPLMSQMKSALTALHVALKS